jgi:arginyl-tRNA synthetase
VGHLRNAILGDTFVRLLRSSGAHVDVQNYIDNTGVQVADVVVGFVHLDKKSEDEIRKLASQPRFDYLCWDVYARASQWYEQEKQNTQVRLDTLHAIEQGGNPTARIADLISTAVLRRHLETMQRLEIEYDFLPRESEILHLHFWEAAFALLKERGVLRLEAEGKNKGCWVMQRTKTTEDAEDTEENQKVIVRSNGTVTYVGKDIAYHLWKFGLLGRDFGYQRFYKYPNGHQCWISSEHDEAGHPHFGGVSAIYNVIDSRQADPQNNVIEAIRALGHEEQAKHYTHFSYEMVALTPRCAKELGYVLSPEEERKAYIEVSGRKGFGVKADDLMDALIAAAKKEVDQRHADIPDAERAAIAAQIAVGALRYFMLKYTKNSVIAFDFKDALSFEGETGPYAQYAVVRAANIFRKAGISPQFTVHSSQSNALDLGTFFGGEEGNEFWELWLTASKLETVVEQCIATTEPAYAAKYVFQLAQLFNNFYHRHHILTEADEEKKKFLLATVAVVSQALAQALGMMGISVPRVM